MIIPHIWTLMGFKSVGKSTIGVALARALTCDFFDLDRLIEEQYHSQYRSSLTYRQIMHRHGEKFFSTLEHRALTTMIRHQSENCILALGGRTILYEKNRSVLKSNRIKCTLIYLKADKNEVFSRMMHHGRPAFIPTTENARDFFNALWNKRIPVYQSFANITIWNMGDIKKITNEILYQLRKRGELS